MSCTHAIGNCSEAKRTNLLFHAIPLAKLPRFPFQLNNMSTTRIKRVPAYRFAGRAKPCTDLDWTRSDVICTYTRFSASGGLVCTDERSCSNRSSKQVVVEVLFRYSRETKLQACSAFSRSVSRHGKFCSIWSCTGGFLPMSPANVYKLVAQAFAHRYFIYLTYLRLVLCCCKIIYM